MGKFFQKLALLWIACAVFIAADIFAMSEDTLVIGCRPWDDGIEQIAGKAHFVDFMEHGRKEVGNTTFHHLDLTDRNISFSAACPSGKFSQFSNENPAKFNTIIIDWATYQHVAPVHMPESNGWESLVTLLRPGGHLIVPIWDINLRTGSSLTEEKAAEVREKLRPLFSSIENIEPQAIAALPVNTPPWDLLRREGNSIKFLLEEQSPIILFTTK